MGESATGKQDPRETCVEARRQQVWGNTFLPFLSTGSRITMISRSSMFLRVEAERASG